MCIIFSYNKKIKNKSNINFQNNYKKEMYRVVGIFSLS